MADINVNVAPYNDRFDTDSNRTKVLFRPDRPLQQSELNEIQSISDHSLRQLGDRIFSDGDIQSGMSFSVNETEKTITIEEGLVYLAGKVRKFNQQSIELNEVGSESIGIKLVQSVVDHNADPSLLDQTQGVSSSLSAGADRLEETVVLAYNDEEAPTIYQFEDGDLFVDPDRPEFSMVNEVLAQRTFEESGSYQVEGFKMWVEPSTEAGKVDLVIDRGTAYVLGYRIHKPTSTRVRLNKSTAFREVVQETHTYSTSSRRSKIGSSSVKEIKQVLAQTQSPVNGITISKGTTDARDAVPAQYTNIDRSSTVLWTNSPEAIYTYGTDYTIVEDSGIQYVSWNTGTNGKEPTPGSSYFMTFEYDRIMRVGVDYKVVTTAQGADLPGWDSYVDFNGMTGLKPKDNGVIRVNYEYFLARADVVTLNSTGVFTIIEGQADRTAAVAVPVHEDPLTLKIGYVFVYPNSNIAEATNNGVVRLRMEDIQKLKSRLENVEYNQAIQALEDQSIVADDPLLLRGVFADGFVDFSRMDTNLSSVALSFDDASITLMTNVPADQMKAPKFAASASTAKVWGRIVTAPYTETREISQLLATEAMNVNPYAVYNKLGVLNLVPATDNWIEEDKVTIENESHMTARLDRWWAHNRPTTQHKDLRGLVDNLVLDDGQSWNSGNYHDDIRNGRSGTLTDVSTTVRNSSIEFIRQKEIQFTATNMMPMSNNLYLSFDGIRVPVSPTGTTVAGAEAGTIRSDANGRATGRFTIPKDIRTGVREVALLNASNSAISTYTAQGTLKTTEEVINRTRVTVNLYDPLAQSFVFPQDRVVTSFDLYFASKSTTDRLIVQVRGLSEGGFPNQTIYAERLLAPSEVKISADGSLATKIALDDPLMCTGGQSYCIVIITDSNDYTMWVSTLGQNRIDAPATKVVSQPYVNGVLFSSSNARTWTVHQSSDLKFSVYTANFNESATVEFDTIQDLDADMILLMATYLTPSNTGCYWEIKAVPQSDVGVVSIDSVPWRPLNNYIEQITSPIVIGLAKLRATFKANRHISPMMILEDLLFVNFISETSGDYVTRNITTTEAPFNQITVSYDATTPAGTRVIPKYSVDGGTTWKTFTAAPTSTPQTAEYSRYTYNQRVSSTAVNTQVKFKLELRADNRFVRPRVRRFTSVFKDEI